MEVAQVGTGKLAVSTLIKRDVAATGHRLLSFTVCFVCSFNSKWIKIPLVDSHMLSQNREICCTLIYFWKWDFYSLPNSYTLSNCYELLQTPRVILQTQSYRTIYMSIKSNINEHTNAKNSKCDLELIPR